jgi:CheY-like chemotaxis protein
MRENLGRNNHSNLLAADDMPGPINVMLIDDDEMTNMIHSVIMSRMGASMEASPFTQAQVALTYLESHPEKWPDVIFLDINMPVMDGWGFLDAYQNIGCTAKLFMLTSSIDPRDVTRALSYPEVEDFVSKPLTIEILRQKLGLTV